MSIMPQFTEIEKADLETFRHLILPDIYEELAEQEEMDDYICLAAWLSDTPVGAMITNLEDNGDISLLSVWTDPTYRRMGIASALRDKMTEIAVALYDWDDMQYGDEVMLKTMYCLRDEYRKPFEEWLMKNDFTDFMILNEADGDRPDVCAATAEVHFFRY